MDIYRATKALERVVARPFPTKAKLRGARVEIHAEPGHLFVIRMDMDQEHAQEAARRLNDVAANVTPWPPEGVVESETTWDSTLHYLAMTDDLAIP